MSATPTNSKPIPMCESEILQEAESVLDAMRPFGWPIAMVRKVLLKAVEQLETEPLREPRPAYSFHEEELRRTRMQPCTAQDVKASASQ